MKSDKQIIAELRQLILDLWEVRAYGIPEMKLWNRVSSARTGDIIGFRPVDKNGISLVPDIKNGRISYTKYFK